MSILSTTPIPVVIEAVQYTPFTPGIIIQLAAKDPSHPLLGATRQIATTQGELAGKAAADLASISWGDAEVAALVVARFAAWGMPVAVVEPAAPSTSSANA